MSQRWITILLVAAVLIGAGAGTALVVRQPGFWIDLGGEVVNRAWPEITRWMFGRMTPEQEKALQRCVRRGGRWDNMRKVCDR